MAKTTSERERSKQQAIENVKMYNKNFENGINYDEESYSFIRFKVNYSVATNVLSLVIEDRAPDKTYHRNNSIYVAFDLIGNIFNFCDICEKNEIDFNTNQGMYIFEKYWEKRKETSISYCETWIYIRDSIKNYFRYERTRLSLLNIIKMEESYAIKLGTSYFNTVELGGFKNNQTIFQYLDDGKIERVKIEEFKIQKNSFQEADKND